MAEFRQGVITSKGLDLLAKAQAGRANITFTRAVIGDGEWDSDTPTETIMAAVALRDGKAEFPVASAEFVNDATVLLSIVASNVENTDGGYYIREVGVYATDGTTEVLYAVYLATEPDWFPAYNSITPFSIAYSVYITVANAESVTVSTPGGALVKWEELDAVIETLQTDAGIAIGTLINDLRLHKWESEEHFEEIETKVANATVQEVGSVTLTNSGGFPFNNSQVSVALTNIRDNLYYVVEVISVNATGGPAGEIEISERQINGFKIAYTGSATSVTVTYAVIGGYDA